MGSISRHTSGTARSQQATGRPLTVPDPLGGVEQGCLHIGHESLQAPPGVRSSCQLIGEGSGVAQIDQQSHLLGTHADQMLVAVMGDPHEPRTGSSISTPGRAGSAVGKTAAQNPAARIPEGIGGQSA